MTSLRMNAVALILFAVITLVMSFTPVRAESRALIALAVNTDGDLAHALAVQDTLKARHGFDHVEVLTDATPDEIFHRMKVFLEGVDPTRVRAAAVVSEQTRRLVWVSGRNGRQSAGLCPSSRTMNASRIRPTGMAIILAPDCLTAKVIMPSTALTIRHSTPPAARISRYFAQPKMRFGVPVAMITLPGYSTKAVNNADRAVLSALRGAQGVAVRPMAFLQALRLHFPLIGGPYVPSLMLSRWRVQFHQYVPSMVNSASSSRGKVEQW